jgi:hypothetical protein
MFQKMVGAVLARPACGDFFCFGVDSVPDGVLTYGQLIFDRVKAAVLP